MIKDILDSFNSKLNFDILKENKETFKIEDKEEPFCEVFTIKKKEWYQKIIEFYIEEMLMNTWVIEELDYNDVLNICLKVAILDKAIKGE